MANGRLFLVPCLLLLLAGAAVWAQERPQDNVFELMTQEVAAAKEEAADYKRELQTAISQLEELHATIAELQSVDQEHDQPAESDPECQLELDNAVTRLAQAATEETQANEKLKEHQARINELEKQVADAAQRLGKAASEETSTQTKLQEQVRRIAELESAAAERTAKLEELGVSVMQATARMEAAEKEAADARAAHEALKAQLGEAESQATLVVAKLEQEEAKLTGLQGKHESEIAATRAELERVVASSSASAQQVEELLREHTAEWLPHWLQKRYLLAHAAVGPALQSAYETTAASTEAVRTNSMHLMRTGSAKAGKLYAQAQPALLRSYSSSKEALLGAHKTVHKHAGPHLATARAALAQAGAAAEAKWAELMKSDMAKKLTRQVRRTVRELEGVAAAQLRKVPALAHLAKRPAVTYIVWAALAAPLLAILLPLMFLGGSSSSSRSRASARGAPPPAGPADGSPSAAAKRAKGRRITMGGESVAFA